MKSGVLVLNFGEPAEPTPESVVAYLERIFSANASLEQFDSEEAMRARSRELAERRAPGLLEEYREIGGSPLNDQARAQAEALEDELTRRGLETRTYVGMQFTEPFIAQAVERALQEGAERIVGLPVYPLCGRSTTVAALEEMTEAVRASGADIEIREISGWHRHPGYLELRVDALRRCVETAGVELNDPATRLVFSAHGTPVRYLDEGNRYDRYVDEWCRAVARRLRVRRYTLGFQNHGNRAIEWTQPDVEAAIEALAETGRAGARGSGGPTDGAASGSRTEAPPADAPLHASVADAPVERVVVDPVSFMHEQSETLAELDRELREEAERLGLEYHRVPVPWDDPRFAALLADLVEPLITGSEPDDFRYGECRCRAGASCLNAADPVGVADTFEG